MKFMCECCKKVHDTPEQAMGCEKKHHEEKVTEEKMRTSRKISDAMTAYVRRYKEFPDININAAVEEMTEE
jgi:hypothetical protein